MLLWTAFLPGTNEVRRCLDRHALRDSELPQFVSPAISFDDLAVICGTVALLVCGWCFFGGGFSGFPPGFAGVGSLVPRYHLMIALAA